MVVEFSLRNILKEAVRGGGGTQERETRFLLNALAEARDRGFVDPLPPLTKEQLLDAYRIDKKKTITGAKLIVLNLLAQRMGHLVTKREVFSALAPLESRDPESLYTTSISVLRKFGFPIETVYDEGAILELPEAWRQKR